MKLALILLCLLLCGAAPVEVRPQAYPVSLSYQEWAQVVAAVRRSDALSARTADDIVNKIAQAVADDQKQGAVQSPQKK